MRKNKKTLIIILSAAILIGGGLAGAKLYMSNSAAKAVKQPGTVDLSPPTAADKQANDDRKEQIVADQKAAEAPVADTGQKTSVMPVISYADSTEVDAFVPNIAENGGTCTLTLSQGASKITKNSDSIADATTTRCRNFILQRSDFAAAGSWDAVVSYSSTRSQGTSSTVKIEVK